MMIGRMIDMETSELPKVEETGAWWSGWDRGWKDGFGPNTERMPKYRQDFHDREWVVGYHVGFDKGQQEWEHRI
jgi:hypothetical protein